MLKQYENVYLVPTLQELQDDLGVALGLGLPDTTALLLGDSVPAPEIEEYQAGFLEGECQKWRALCLVFL